jgi:uracil-DNA glycosylase
MFVGEGPGVEEEEYGRPFIGRSGKILRGVLTQLGFQDFYITNAVTCRSCAPMLDPQGNPRLRKGLPIYKDEKPLPVHLSACNPRLQDEIYLVDPVVIVALGGTAAEVLLGRPLSILSMRGNPEHIEIAGAAHRPNLTDKKGAWHRKAAGQLSYPTEQNTVRYLVVPTLHPAYVARNLADRGPRSAFQLFVSDIKLALKIYTRYKGEAYGEAVDTEEEENQMDAVAVREEFDNAEDDFDIDD